MPETNRADFDDRLRHAQQAHGKLKGAPDDKPPRASRRAIGVAFRLSTELVAGPVVGTAIGWFLDQWLNTSPFLLLIFFFLGVAAGIFNVMRSAREISDSTALETDNDEDEPAVPAPHDTHGKKPQNRQDGAL